MQASTGRWYRAKNIVRCRMPPPPTPPWRQLQLAKGVLGRRHEATHPYPWRCFSAEAKLSRGQTHPETDCVYKRGNKTPRHSILLVLPLVSRGATYTYSSTSCVSIAAAAPLADPQLHERSKVTPRKRRPSNRTPFRRYTNQPIGAAPGPSVVLVPQPFHGTGRSMHGSKPSNKQNQSINACPETRHYGKPEANNVAIHKKPQQTEKDLEPYGGRAKNPMLLNHEMTHPGAVLELHDSLVEVGPEKLALLHLKTSSQGEHVRDIHSSTQGTWHLVWYTLSRVETSVETTKKLELLLCVLRTMNQWSSELGAWMLLTEDSRRPGFDLLTDRSHTKASTLRLTGDRRLTP